LGCIEGGEEMGEIIDWKDIAGDDEKLAGLERLSILDLLGEEIIIKDVEFFEYEGNERARVFFDENKYFITSSEVLLKQLKKVKGAIDNGYEGVRCRIIKPKGKRYFTLE